jgi:hypothetical protein
MLPGGRFPLYLLAALASRLPSLFEGFFSGDEATYSALAVRVLSGALPWAGAVDHKPPGAELFYGLVFLGSGPYQLWAIRAALIVVVALTGLVLAAVADESGASAGAARRAGLLYVIASAIGLPPDAYAVNAELLANLPIALAALGIARSRPASLLGAGALCALAGTLRYQAAFIGLGFAVALLRAPGRPGVRALRLAPLAVGFLAGAGGFLAAIRALGLWEPFVFWGWRFNFDYMRSVSFDEALAAAAASTALIALGWLPLVIAATRARPGALVSGWLVAALVALVPGFRFFPHYYFALLPPLALWAGRAELGAGRTRRAFVAATLALASISWLVAWGYHAQKPGQRALDAAYRDVGGWVRAHAARRDRLFVWGNSPEIYSYARLPMGTRFVFCNYHAGKIWGGHLNDSDDGGDKAHQVPRAWEELLADLDREPPRFIVDAAAGGLDHFIGHPISRYPRLAERVAERYARVALVDQVPIYELR